MHAQTRTIAHYRWASGMLLVLLLTISLGLSAAPSARPAAVVLVENGRPRLSIAAGSVKEPVEELRTYLKRISGADIKVEAPTAKSGALYVGLASDFPTLKIESLKDLGPEGFILKTDANNVYLIANTNLGVRHAVATFLHKVGCRWFFPGAVWEVVPRQDTITVSFDERQSPSYSIGRHIHYGYGAYGPCADDFKQWNLHNRMGGPTPVGSGHTWFGLQPARDFKEHPEWFAEVRGQRKTSKPCYSHPDVIKQAIRHGLELAASGAGIISMTPPDGLDYCECERCMAVCKGGKPFRKHLTSFAQRPDGVLINVTSENVFHCVNQVAAAVAEKYPRALVGCYAYSAYSHPPSFKLHPNVFVQMTTAYRRTDLSLAEQVSAFRSLGCQVGLRDYFSVYQWDWDVKPPQGKLAPARIKEIFAGYHAKLGVRSINAEASNNWGPRGLSYYLAAQVMWDVNADVDALLRDFYEKAFGPAAEPMKRYYRHWYGAGQLDDGAAAGEDTDKKEELVKGEKLKELFQDLDEAAQRAKDRPDCLARIDHLRMYVHYLLLRQRTTQAGAGKKKDRDAVIEAVKAETIFGAHLAYTNMIHTRAMVGKAFDRRFKPFVGILKQVPESQSSNKGWRKIGPPPSHADVEKFWAEDRAALQSKTAAPAKNGVPDK